MKRRVTTPWDIWGGKGWPATAADEAEFVEVLRARADGREVDVTAVSQMEVVCLMTALRVAAPADRVLERGKGLDAAHLLSAYERLSRRLRLARAAWEEIVEVATPDAVDDAAEDATPIAELLVVRLRSVAATAPDTLADEVARVAGRTMGLQALSGQVEDRLAETVAPSEVGVDLGRQLFDPSRSSLWANPMFIPSRVTQLAPVRVSDLLGWRRDDPRQL